MVCATGYTGEDGFEFFCSPDHADKWFQAFIDAGAKPAGLGARDSLRLEMGYPLNGSDLTPNRTPIEAGLSFFTKLDKANFIGKKALENQLNIGLQQKLVAIQCTEKGAPPRAGYLVLNQAGERIGELSSGVISPSTLKGIGMAYLPLSYAEMGTPLFIEVRNRKCPAVVRKKPFYSK